MHRLHVVSGPDIGRSFDLDREMIHIGKAPENEIQIKDRFISRRHLEVLKKGEKYYLKDLESANGTFVDGDLIEPGIEVELPEGVPVVIGMSVFCLGEQCADDIIDVLHSLGVPGARRNPPERHSGRPKTVLKNMELLRDVSRVLTQSLDLKDVLDRILESILRLLNRIDRGAIILLDQETGKPLEFASKARKGFEGEAEGYCQDVVDRVIQNGNEIMVLGGKGPVFSDELRRAGIKSVMCVPLLNRSRVIGVIYVDSITDSHGFRKDDLSLFKELSIPAAHAIHNSLLYSRVGKEDPRNK